VQLALVSADDGSVRPIRDLGDASTEHASISPDGQFIVYDGPQKPLAAARDIFIVRNDGSGDRRLIEHAANDSNPVWSSDGLDVLFASDRSGTTDVWSVAVRGGLAQSEPQMIHRNIGRLWLRGLTDTGSYFYEATIGAVDVYEALVSGAAAAKPTLVSTTY